MRIGIDARMYGTRCTGIGRYNQELINRLAQIDSENEYVIFLRKVDFENFVPPNDQFKKVLADFPHYSFSEQFKFPGLIRRQKIDLMHFTHFNAPIFYAQPLVVTIHDLTLSFFPGKKMNRFWYRWVYRIVMSRVVKNAKRIIAISKNTKKDLIKLFKAPEKKVSVVYNGISSDFSSKTQVKRADLMSQLNIEKPYFLYTGVWRDHKNVVGLIHAFKKANEKLGNTYQLVITGRPNPIYHEIPDTIKELNLEKDVLLVGMVPEDHLKGLYQNATSYVFPSFYEGFGLPPLEAMQCGVPVVTSDQASIPEVCGEENAVYFNPYDEEDMVNKLYLIATDASLRQRLVDRGKERVKFFDWNKMAIEINTIYLNCEKTK